MAATSPTMRSLTSASLECKFTKCLFVCEPRPSTIPRIFPRNQCIHKVIPLPTAYPCYSLEKSGELAWRLPLAKEYADCLESSVADINNCNYTVKCSTISAALFLKEFVDSAKWLHWDIAGTAFEKSDARGTGYGVRTLVNLVLDLAEEK